MENKSTKETFDGIHFRSPSPDLKIAEEKTSESSSKQKSGVKHLPSSLAHQTHIARESEFKHHHETREKHDSIEDDENEIVEQEFLALMRKPNVGKALISHDPRARHVATGIKINYMNMRNSVTNELIWESHNFGSVTFLSEMEERIPKKILHCPAVTREINFTSKEEINNFKIEQKVFFRGVCIEEWFFKFGFVIPGSTNSWEQTIEAAPPSAMFKAEELSGNVTFETTFLDEKLVLCKNVVRIFYV